MPTLTPANVRTWSPDIILLAGNNLGALAQDSVTFNVTSEVKEIPAANSRVIVKRLPITWACWIEFGALEFTRARLAEIIQKADAASMEIGTATELIELACVVTFELSDGSSATATGTVTVRPELVLGSDVQTEAAPVTRLDFVPDVGTSDLIATWAQAAA